MTIIQAEQQFNVSKIRQDFPALQQLVHDKPLVYLDNAATTQKPSAVLSAMQHYYSYDNANVHRGVHALSVRATQAYEEAREGVRKFINATSHQEIIFVRGATEGINLVAQSFGRTFLKQDDEIIISTMEHHSNIVPWQILCEQVGAKLKIIQVSAEGELNLAHFETLLNKKTKLVSLVHVSNAIGTVNPVKKIIDLAHAADIPVLLDGAQATPHMMVDVQKLNCDFYVFSGHKMYGPTGIGVLYAKSQYLEKMPPYQAGGDMILEVSFESTKFNKLPFKFEAGTPNIAGAIGLHAAINYLQNIHLSAIHEYEQDLLHYATDALSSISGLTIIGQAQQKTAVISFILKDIHPHDVGTILDHQGIAIRAGHHCAMPLLTRFNLNATARASFSFYNTFEEIDKLVAGIEQAKRLFS